MAISSKATLDESRLSLFVAGVTDYAIYQLSPEGVINSWNAGAQRFKGYTPEEIIGNHFSLFYTPEDLATSLPARALQTAITEGKFEDEGWRVRKDGSRFWASVVIDPIRDDEGVLIGFVKVTRDITERKQVADALHASEEQFRLLVQGVTDYAIYMLSPEGNISSWNLGAERIKGYKKEEVIGTHFSRFYVPEDAAAKLPANALNTAFATGRFESEGLRIRKDGSRFWAHVVIDPIKNELGTLIGYAKVTRDITERRDATAALQKAQEALFHSQKLESIGKLTGGVAHDFNNLLGVIMNGLLLIRTDNPNPQHFKVLESMERAVNQGATLTRQLLTFARQQPLVQERHDLNRVVGSFESVLRRALTSAVRFDLHLAQTLAPVLIDAQQFEAALLNLIVNAKDATPNGGLITLQTALVTLADAQINELPAGKYVEVSVADTGHGMTPDVVKKAIEPFFTTKPVGKGTGLGLSQVYGLIKQSNGEMTIESDAGSGCSIALYFPALEGHADAQSQQEEIEKVLIVDDQPDILDIAVELFRTLGYEVLSANNGEDAIKILQRTPSIDVLFSDVFMPGISGIELALEARTLQPEIKIVLASGYPDPALRAGHANLNEFDFVAKPYRIAEIVKKLRMA